MTAKGSHHRVIALVGPQSSGKTTLLEAILRQTGKLGPANKASARAFGDTSPESKAREMGIEINFATTDFMGDTFSFVDCPGATELAQEAFSALAGVDAAIVVTEPDPEKIMGLSPLLKHLERSHIPHYIFVNKVDRSASSIRDLAQMLDLATTEQVVLRQIPIRDGETITGYVDLASERAYTYKEGTPSETTKVPDAIEDQIAEARYMMLETLADFDEHLMEELLEDITPPKEEIFEDLSADLQKDLIIPVFIGAAAHQNGVFRLLKALRHEVPDIAGVQDRFSLDPKAKAPIAQVIKTLHTTHGGKASIVRVLQGEVAEGATLNGERVAGILTIYGDKMDKVSSAKAGDLVAFSRMEKVSTGDVLSEDGQDHGIPRAPVLDPVYSVALAIDNRSDEVKLATSLAKICDEDPALIYEQVADTHETVLRGQGEIHLQIASEKLASKYGLSVSTRRPTIPYKETIRAGTTHHSRYKKQSGGHGQFGDVVVEIAPLPAGSGFAFSDRITGGAVPKQYIPSVEAGVKEYLDKGPLGFPVVDVGVVLTDGSYHTVDSSDMAFKTAGRLAMSEAMPECQPVLLEPIMSVHFYIPSEHTPKVNALVSGRRGQILGFDARPGWEGWDEVAAHLPQSELQDIIIELRSMTQGAGTFTATFDHLSPLTGRLADQVTSQRNAAE